jgi:hypothetical protein
MTLKLYVWENVLTDYTDGVMFALAESVEEARSLILTEWGYTESKGTVWQDLQKEPQIVETPAGFLCWGGG